MCFVRSKQRRDLNSPLIVFSFCRPQALRVLRSLVHATQIGCSYLLMGVVMTFNAGFLFAIVGGAFLGHYLFARPLSRHAAESSPQPCH